MCGVCAYVQKDSPPAVMTNPPETLTPSPSLWLFFQTILVGDSGVGKTSLLVQFDQGKFIPGSFSATVGIGFTVSTHCLCTWARVSAGNR
jgi:hypothetical protein